MADNEHAKYHIEVAYAEPGQAVIIPLVADPGTTVRQAIHASGIMNQIPAIDLAVNKVGVFSIPRALDDPVAAGDRIEIYRPLSADPKQVRRQRAGRQARRKS